METLYNNTFLNSLFTSDEFNFIKHLDSNNDEFSKMLEVEKNSRDLIVNLINGLNDSIIQKNMQHEDLAKEENMLSKSRNVFETINSSISMLQVNQEISEKINQDIVDLLIKVEAEENNVSESKFADEINNLKTDISYFSNVVDDMKKTIQKNDSIVHGFVVSPEVQEFLKTFSIDYSSFIQTTPKEPIRPKEDFEQVSNNVDNSNIEVSNDMVENNNCLLISETKGKVYLPFSKIEILEYLEKYPDQYTSFEDVVNQEFIYPVSYYLKHPVVSRFRESYALIRDREAKSIFEAFKIAMDTMFNYDLNPAIIAACKSQSQFEHYIECLSNNKLDDFKDFEIKFEVAPLKVKPNKR